jgi:hypothetical protein
MIFMNIEHRTSNIERRMSGRMPGYCMWGLLVVGMLVGVLNSGAQQTNNNDSIPDFGAFNIITQRNIFDPNRSGRIRSDYTPHTRPKTVDTITLVGTMSYTKGKFAFFDGSSSQYKKVLEPGANIAGYTVTEITGNAVTLAANGKEFQMKMGAQLRNPGDNKWELSSHAEESTNPEPDNESGSSASLPPASSPEMSEVLKQMMQKRQQELQQESK